MFIEMQLFLNVNTFYLDTSTSMLAFFRVYPPGGFTNFLQSKSTSENSHLGGNTTSRPPD
jgi:hypothetical protein